MKPERKNENGKVKNKKKMKTAKTYSGALV